MLFDRREKLHTPDSSCSRDFRQTVNDRIHNDPEFASMFARELLGERDCRSQFWNAQGRALNGGNGISQQYTFDASAYAKVLDGKSLQAKRQIDNIASKKKLHKWAKEIKAWADGATIQYADKEVDVWADVIDPPWYRGGIFRIKPEIEYPQTMMSDMEIFECLGNAVHFYQHAFRNLINIAIRRAIEDGDVIINPERKPKE
jgi:hypothetical protein